jgi:cytochrome-b5 reductase
MREHLPAPAPDTTVFLCGPPLMIDALEGTLKGIGYAEQSIVLP